MSEYEVSPALYSLICDAIERAWHHDSATPEVGDFRMTSSYAREAALRISTALEQEVNDDE